MTNRWFVTTFVVTPYYSSFLIVITTDVPCHLWARFSSNQPQRHPRTRTIRGLNIVGDVYYCFTAYHDIEQEEVGDTLIHTFNLTPWSFCQTRWFYFHGEIATIASPSNSPIFEFHHPGVPPLIEEQTINRVGLAVLFNGSFVRAGQRLSITNRVITKLAIGTRNCLGFPTGAVTLTIRKVSDDSLMASKLFGDASTIWAGAGFSPPQLHEVTFDTPVIIFESVRILLEFSGGDINNYLAVSGENINVKGGEYLTRYIIDYTQDIPTSDACYRYTYYKEYP